MNGIILIVAFLLAAGATFATNWLALIPWRRNRDKHWTEQARLLYPASVAARSNLWTVPAILTLFVALVWPHMNSLWIFAGVLSTLGAHGATVFFDHEVVPRIPWDELLRHSALGLLVRFFQWYIFIFATVTMPYEFNSLAWSIAGAVLLLWIVWTRLGWIWFVRAVGLVQPSPDKLHSIVDQTSARMNIPYKEALMERSHVSQAYAIPDKGMIIFTKRMLEIFPDDEVAAICAHEMAHLTESRAVRLLRMVRTLSYMPWIFFVPLTHCFGIFPFYGLIAMTIIIPRVFGKLSRKLESRADQIAKATEGDPGTYARALLRLYEDRLTPAVISKGRPRTHPDLYDRLIAAGITPDFPKPIPAVSMAWYSHVLAGLVGILFAILAMRIATPIMESWGT